MERVVAARTRQFDKSLALDLAERAAVTALFAWFAADLLRSAVTGIWFNWLLLFSEAVIVVFILLRRRTAAVSLRPPEWALAAAGSWGPLLVRPGGPGPLAEPALLAAMMLAGVLLQVSAKLVLARSFGLIPANRGVKREGPYRLLRHPMYAGYVLTHIGFLLAYPTLWNAAVYGTCLCLQVMRIQAEERLLAEDAEYRAFQSAVRWRLLPGVF